MGIVLTILKIIGILLLILLGLILFIILSVLFIPIRYRAKVEKIPDGVDTDSSISWFFGAIKICIGFAWSKGSGRKVTKDIRLFGISLIRIKNWFRERKKRRAMKAREWRRQERIQELEDLRLTDPEAFEKERQMALARRRRRREREAAREKEEADKEVSETAAENVAAEETAPQLPAPPEGEHEETPAEDDTYFNAEDFENLAAAHEAEKKAETVAADAASAEKSSGGLLRRDLIGRLKSLYYRLKRWIRARIGLKSREEGVSEKKPRPAGKSFWAKIFDFLNNFDDYIIKFLDYLDDLPIKTITFIFGLPRKLWNLITKVLGKLEKTIVTVKKIGDFIQDTRTRAFTRLVFRTIRKLLGHIFPRKINGYLHFGFADPSWTGITLGALAVIDPSVRGDFRYEPDFEEKVLEGVVDVKGRIFLFYLLFLGLRLYLDKNTKFVLGFIRGTNGNNNSKRRGRGRKKSEAEETETVDEEVA